MPKKKTKKKEIIQNDSFIFIMLLATISILAVSLKDYTFSIGGIDIIFSRTYCSPKKTPTNVSAHTINPVAAISIITNLKKIYDCNILKLSSFSFL